MAAEEEWGMVMPFTVCRTAGGPLDDHSFVEGVRYGKIDAILTLRPSQHSEYVHPDLVGQLDLLAMHHGYSFIAVPWDEHPDDWVLVTFGGDTAEPPV